MLDFFTWHFGDNSQCDTKYIDANCFSQKLRQFKLDLQENFLRGWDMCGIFSLFSEAVGNSHVWPGTASVSCDFRTVLPAWSCWLQFVPVLSGGWF